MFYNSSELRNSDKLETCFGQKAAGLLFVTPSWVPKYFLVSYELHEQISLQKIRSKKGIRKYLSKKKKVDLVKYLKSIDVSECDKVIVRSSCTDESFDSRGKYESLVVDATVDAVIIALSDLITDFDRLESEGHYAFIIQKYVKPVVRGHLSNERRVSYLVRDWVAEYEPQSDRKTPTIYTFKIFKHRIDSPFISLKLSCNNFPDVEKILHQPAGHATFLNTRVHYEWVWDGSRVWIVQADIDTESRGDDPHKLYKNVNRLNKDIKLSVVNELNSTTARNWPKADHVNQLSAAGLPTTKLWILDNSEVLAHLSVGNASNELISDIENILHSPIVIRTDLKKAYSQVKRQMLPRTETVSSVKKAIEFFVNVSTKLVEEGVKSDEFCFLIHNFIPSISSAFCYASPNLRKVHIDSIWGLPDGLSYYQHDSFELDPEDPDSIEEKIRYKDYYLGVDDKGDWVPKKAGKPWDWQKSINKADILEIGIETKKFAQSIQSPVKLMWFVEVASDIGHPSNLPWYYECQEVPDSVDYADEVSFFLHATSEIRTIDDIEHYAEELDAGNELLPLKLYPTPTFLRNKEYIEKAAELAKKANVAIILHGSVLQHAYYQLESLGAKVKCIDPFSSSTNKQTFNKLVRDKIPQSIEEKGESVKYKKLEDSELIKRLREKVIEEAYEIFWAVDEAETVEEIADINETINALIGALKISRDLIESEQEKKREKRGGFDLGLVLEETEERPVITTLGGPARKVGSRVKKSSTQKSNATRIRPAPSSGESNPQLIHFTSLGLGLLVRYEKDWIALELRNSQTADELAEYYDSVQLELPI